MDRGLLHRPRLHLEDASGFSGGPDGCRQIDEPCQRGDLDADRALYRRRDRLKLQVPSRTENKQYAVVTIRQGICPETGSESDFELLEIRHTALERCKLRVQEVSHRDLGAQPAGKQKDPADFSLDVEDIHRWGFGNETVFCQFHSSALEFA